MWFLRTVVGYCLIKKREEDMRKDLHVTDVTARIKDHQTELLGHVERMKV
jgi:hypothetical protein